MESSLVQARKCQTYLLVDNHARSASDWQNSLMISFHTFLGILTIHATHRALNQNLGWTDTNVDDVGQNNVGTIV